MPPLKAEQPRIRSATPSSEEEVTLILLGITLQGEPLRDSVKHGNAGVSGCLEYSSLIKSSINCKK